MAKLAVSSAMTMSQLSTMSKAPPQTEPCTMVDHRAGEDPDRTERLLEGIGVRQRIQSRPRQFGDVVTSRPDVHAGLRPQDHHTYLFFGEDFQALGETPHHLSAQRVVLAPVSE